MKHAVIGLLIMTASLVMGYRDGGEMPTNRVGEAEVDPNILIAGWLDYDPNAFTWITDGYDWGTLTYTDISITADSGCEVIISFDEVIDVKGDPNCMTDAAWLFFDRYLRHVVDDYIEEELELRAGDMQWPKRGGEQGEALKEISPEKLEWVAND